MDETLHTPTVTQDILNLRFISDAAETYVCDQEYVSKYGQDTVKEEDLLFDLYEIIKNELVDLGIVYWDTQYNPLEDWYQARSLYYLRKVFDEDVLLILLKQNDSVIPGIETIISSDESDESDIHLVLELLNNTFIDHPDILMCMEFQDKIISTDRFTEHLKAIIYTHKHLATTTIDDPEIVLPYIKQIELGRVRVKEAVERILLNLDETGKIMTTDITNCGRSSIDMELLDTLLRNYDLDKLQPNEIGYYAVLDRPDENIDKVQLEFKQKYMDIHHNRSPHHIEYWKSHGILNLTNTNILMLMAHIYNPYLNGDEFVTEFANMRKIAITIFTEDQIKILDTYGLVLMGTMRDHGQEDQYGHIPDHSIVS